MFVCDYLSIYYRDWKILGMVLNRLYVKYYSVKRMVNGFRKL